MSLRSQKPQTDQDKGQSEKGLLNFREPVQTAPQTPKRMQPGDRPLHEPAEHAQMAAGFPVPLAYEGGDPEPTQQPPPRLGIVSRVSLQALRFLTLRPRLAAHRRHVRQNLEDLCDLVDVGGGYRPGQRDA